MIFSSNYTCILGGQVKSVPMESDIESDMSIFGDELIYVNAGLIQQCNDTGNHALIEEAIRTQADEAEALGRPYPTTSRQLIVVIQHLLTHRRVLPRYTILRYPQSHRFS